MSVWDLAYDGLDPGHERLREALCTLGNGYMATRGAAPESAADDDIHYPGTYVAGLFDRLTTEVSGRDITNEDLVNCPNWLPLTWRAEGGEWLDLGRVEVLDHAQRLDLRAGVLHRDLRVRDAHGRTTRMTQRRLVSMDDEHLAALETTLTAEDWSGRVEVASTVDGRVVNAGVARYRRLRSDHLVPVAAYEAGPETVEVEVATRQSRVRVAVAARTRLTGSAAGEARRRAVVEEGRAGHVLSLDVAEGVPVTVEKVVALHTSRDRAISEPGLASREALARAGGFDELLAPHVTAWAGLWGRFGVTVEPDERAALILNLHVFHLLQTVSWHSVDLDVGVPARGLHGEAYRGHIFWDELFIFPFLTLRAPELTRALLLYRHRRLPAARRAAAEAGHAGAMYPWQSGSDGREESQLLHLNPVSGRWLPDASHLQRHIGIAVAVNVWRYWEATGDDDFMAAYGAELLVEIARFWASAATLDEAGERYAIRGVMGPDEYHEGYPGAELPGLDDNAYTNVMAVWVLCRALDAHAALPGQRRGELDALLAITPEELARWEDVSRRMGLAFLPGPDEDEDGVVAQFRGYERLEEFDWEGYRDRYGDISRLDRILEAEGDSTDRYRLSKQADVLMLYYLLSSEELGALFERMGYGFDPESIPRTIDYYMARTSHGSTLSRLVHAWVLARSDRPRSAEFFRQVLESDITDVQGGTTAEGIHLGAMAGTVDMVQRTYLGIDVRQAVLRLDPRLPDGLDRIALSLRFRQHWGIRVEVTHERLRVTLPASGEGPVTMDLAGTVRVVQCGETVEVPLPA